MAALEVLVSQNDPLPIETYALALAHLLRRRREPVAEVLASLGITAEAFSAAERHWVEELAEAFDRRKGAPAMKFSSALMQAQRKVGLLDPAAGEAASAAWSAPAPAKAEVPSFLRAEPAPPIVAPPASGATPSPLAGTYKMDSRDLLAAVERGRLPFVPPDPSKAGGAFDAHAEARPGVERKALPGVGETMNADLSAIIAAVERGAMPFASPKPQGDDADRPQLPLETYASITRALAHGEPREEALKKHGLTADAFDKLAKAWAHRLQQDPQLMALFKELANTASVRRGP